MAQTQIRPYAARCGGPGRGLNVVRVMTRQGLIWQDAGGQGVLFDCDGVLVDSDASVERAWRRWTDEYGLARAPGAGHGARAPVRRYRPPAHPRAGAGGCAAGRIQVADKIAGLAKEGKPCRLSRPVPLHQDPAIRPSGRPGTPRDFSRRLVSLTLRRVLVRGSSRATEPAGRVGFGRRGSRTPAGGIPPLRRRKRARIQPNGAMSPDRTGWRPSRPMPLTMRPGSGDRQTSGPVPASRVLAA